VGGASDNDGAVAEERPWWRSLYGVPKWYERWSNRRRWDDGLPWSPRLGSVALAAVLVGGVAVLAGYVAEWRGWDGFLIGLVVAWAVAAVTFTVAVAVRSRRSGRPFWRVAWDGFRGLLRFIIEVG
jgi:hypothetical protein